MGTLTSVFGEIKNAVLAMRGNAYDEDDKDYLNEVIDDTIKEHPEEAESLRKFKEIANLTDKDLAQKAERFDNYGKIEDKIKGSVDINVEFVKKSSKSKEEKERVRE